MYMDTNGVILADWDRVELSVHNIMTYMSTYIVDSHMSMFCVLK